MGEYFFTIMFVIFLSFLDITLTWYRMHLDKVKGCFDLRKERNFIPRLIMGKSCSWKRYSIAVFIFPVLFAVICFIDFFIGKPQYTYIFVGMLSVVNYIHFIGITEVYANWNNPAYFKRHRNHWKKNQIGKSENPDAYSFPAFVLGIIGTTLGIFIGVGGIANIITGRYLWALFYLLLSAANLYVGIKNIKNSGGLKW